MNLKRKRHGLEYPPPDAICMKMIPLRSLLAALTLASAPPAFAADQWANAPKMTVVMVDNRFEPADLTFGHGKAYDLHLENHGKDMHEFTAPEFLKAAKLRDKARLASAGTDIVVQPGKSVDIFLIAPRKGPYKLICADHDWDGMVGSITVN